MPQIREHSDIGNRKQLEAAHHSPEFRKQWPHFGELIKEAEPCLYEVTHVEAA